MTIKYLCFLDFEATCDYPIQIDHEIIEFPMVLTKYENGKLTKIDQFHEYVRPSINTVLTKFCLDFTHIKQETVDQAEYLPVILKKATKWIKQNIDNEEDLSNLIFVTWGESDFKTILFNETSKKKIKVPSMFKKFIDIKKVFTKIRDKHNLPKGRCRFGDAIKILGLTFKGQQHSGIDDTLNTYFMAEKLLQMGWIPKDSDITIVKYNYL